MDGSLITQHKEPKEDSDILQQGCHGDPSHAAPGRSRREQEESVPLGRGGNEGIGGDSETHNEECCSKNSGGGD